MAQYVNRPKLLPDDVLDRFKYEIADEIGLLNRIESVGWPDLSARDCGRIGGKIGGNMVKVMIRYAEQSLSQGQKAEIT
ncbi:MAG: small, acid-soluble spore protein, alpha/beta type [Bacillota bacterium]